MMKAKDSDEKSTKQSSSPGELMNSILELDNSCPITETRLFSVELFRRVTGPKVFSSVNGCSSDYHDEDEEEEEDEEYFQRKLEKLMDYNEATKWTSRLDYLSAKYMELKELIGSKRGDRRKGMNEVKKILNKDGFMDSYDPREDDNDIFDEKLEKAIHVYHHYYNHGKGSGIIDSATLKNLTNDRRTCNSEKYMHARDKKLRMGYYANGNDVPSRKSVREFLLSSEWVI